MRRGFTLAESLVAVALLATVGIASLRLMIVAQNTLSAVTEREKLLDTAKEIEAGIVTGSLEARGTKDEFRWESEEKEAEFFGEDFGRLELSGLDFDGEGRASQASQTISLKWREITVSDDRENKIIIYLESDEDREKDELARDSDESAESDEEDE